MSDELTRKSNRGTLLIASPSTASDPEHGVQDSYPDRVRLARPRGGGDVIMSTATLVEYRLHHCNQHITFATEPQFIPLMETNPWVDEVVPFTSVDETDHLIIHPEAWRERRHAIRLQLRNLGLDGDSLDIYTVGNVYPTIPERVDAFAKIDPLRPAVAVHFKGSKPTNTWPWGEELCQSLRKMGLTPVQIGSAKDNRIPSACDFRGIGWRETAALLQRVEFVVCTDSAINHLAAATDTPAIVLFPGCGDPVVTGYDTNINLMPALRRHTILPRERAKPSGYGNVVDKGMASLTPTLVLEYCKLLWEAVKPGPEVDVTVIMSAWNHVSHLKRAVDSILSQEGVTLELFLIDDGSTDGTDELVGRYAYHPQVHTVSFTHRGIAHARNYGLRRAAGRYICTFDADDEMLPGCLEKRVRALEAHPERMWAICRMSRWHSEMGVDVEDCNNPKSGWRMWKDSGLSFWDFRMGQTAANVEPGSSSMFRRECVDRIGLFNHTLHEDAVRHLLLLRFFGAPVVVDECLYRYRKHRENILARRRRRYSFDPDYGFRHYRRAFNMLVANADEREDLSIPPPEMREVVVWTGKD